MIEDIDYIMFDEAKIAEAVQRLGQQISEDYKDKNLLLVGTLKGSVVFMSDLMRKISIDCTTDFMVVKSYMHDKSTGTINIVKDIALDLSGYDVLIIEDILDTGRTLYHIKNMLKVRKPESLRICTLFDKPSGREANIYADYIGMEVADEFIVGYGLDYDEKYRNLPFVGVLKKDCYQ